MPSLVDMLPRKRRVSDLPGYGQASPISEMIRGFAGKQPAYSVMQPDADELRRAGELGEQASVASQFYGALMPFAASAAAAKAGQGIGLSPLTVFHGSPHRFTRFDASKIGTGEGAQAYGHGLYFAENPAVAKGYQSRLAGGTDPYQYQYQGQMYEPSNEKNPITHALGLIYHQGKKVAQDVAKRGLADAKAGDPFALDMGGVDYYQRMLNIANAAKKTDIKATQGAFYKVDLPDEKIAQMVNWDVSINKQPESIKQVLLPLAQKYGVAKTADVGTLLGWMQREMPASEVSNKLREAGIPGIRYLDQGSRGVKRGTSNFVVFPGEEQHLKMLEINNVPLVDMLPKVR